MEYTESKSPITPKVANLILSLVYSDVLTYGKQTAVDSMVPGSILQAHQIPALINKLPLLETTSQVEESPKALDTPENLIHAQILAAFGDVFIPANDSLLVRGMPRSAVQLVLNKSTKKNLDDFEKHIVKANNESTLLFHGTAFHILSSILRKGFTHSGDRRYGLGSFFAEDPYVSYWFALSRGMNHASHWGMSSYKGHGLLLGCKVAGEGRYVEMEGGRVHVINDPENVMIRYIVIVPSGVDQTIYGNLKRHVVENDMVERLKLIRAGQIGNKTPKT